MVRLGRSDVINHFTSPKRDIARQQYYTSRNNLYLLWCNIPAPYVLWRLVRSSAGNIVFGVRLRSLGPAVRGLVDGWLGLAGLRAQRRPISNGCYQLLQSLRASPRNLAEIEAVLPRLAADGKIGAARLVEGDAGDGGADGAGSPPKL